MSFEIFFDEAAHTYQWEGIYLPGCTTVTGILPKQWLAAWAAKECVTYILENGDFTSDQKKIIMDGKGAWRRKSKKAADSGTAAHAHIESYIKTGTEPLLFENEDVKNSFNLFLLWLNMNKVEWIESEVVVGSKNHMYAGKFDATAKINGKVTLVDFKTSSGIYAEQYYQTGGYQIAYEEMGKTPKIEQRMILWVPKTGSDFEARIVPTPFESDKRVFLAALELYKRLADSERILEALKKAS